LCGLTSEIEQTQIELLCTHLPLSTSDLRLVAFLSLRGRPLCPSVFFLLLLSSPCQEQPLHAQGKDHRGTDGTTG
jgi:hypothetical protein